MTAAAFRPAVATIAARWDDPTDHHCFNGNGVSCVTYNRMVDEAGADIKALVGEVERLRAAETEKALAHDLLRHLHKVVSAAQFGIPLEEVRRLRLRIEVLIGPVEG